MTTTPFGGLGIGPPDGRSCPKLFWFPRISSPFPPTVDDTALAAVRCYHTRHTMYGRVSKSNSVLAGAPMHPEEIEVKFLIDDLAAMRQRLVALGATCTTPRTYEANLLFDTSDAQLRGHGCLL